MLVTIGVHSPKFVHEADPDARAAAVERYDVAHPVLDDLRFPGTDPEVRREIIETGLAFEVHSTTLRMDRRMPRENSRGWIVQPARGAGWPNVRIDRHEFP